MGPQQPCEVHPLALPAYGYRLDKLAAAHRVLLAWAQGLRWREKARSAFEKWKNAQAKPDVVVQVIAEARAYAKELLELAVRTETVDTRTDVVCVFDSANAASSSKS
jgi:hypothetical protein